jgi:hypothetical protein
MRDLVTNPLKTATGYVFDAREIATQGAGASDHLRVLPVNYFRRFEKLVHTAVLIGLTFQLSSRLPGTALAAASG